MDDNIPDDVHDVDISDNSSPECDDELLASDEQADESVFYVKNALLNSIADVFCTESKMRLSAFLRKKIHIKFNSITSCHFDEIDHDYTKLLMLNFHIMPDDKYGLITFDFVFLHSVINLLYGGGVNDDNSIVRGMGKSGFTIASKITSIFLEVYQKALIDHLKNDIQLSNISAQLHSAFKQEDNKKSYNFSFDVIFDSLICNLNLVIPETLFTAANHKATESDDDRSRNHSNDVFDNDEAIFDSKAKKELIDTAIHVAVNLEKVSMKLKDVVNLKPGDIIPVSSPDLVYISLNNKPIFKASAGQTNQRRAVKIIDKL